MTRHSWICSLALTGTAIISAAVPGWQDRQDSVTAPAQPLLAQVKRLEESLDQLGEPLPSTVKEALRKLDPSQGDGPVAKEVQRVLDPLCLAAVDVNAD